MDSNERGGLVVAIVILLMFAFGFGTIMGSSWVVDAVCQQHGYANGGVFTDGTIQCDTSLRLW